MSSSAIASTTAHPFPDIDFSTKAGILIYVLHYGLLLQSAMKHGELEEWDAIQPRHILDFYHRIPFASRSFNEEWLDELSDVVQNLALDKLEQEGEGRNFDDLKGEELQDLLDSIEDQYYTYLESNTAFWAAFK